MRFECNKNDEVIKKRKTKAKTGPKHRQWQNDEDAEQCPQEIYFLPIKKYLPFKSGVPTNFWLPQPRVITFLSKTHFFLSHSRFCDRCRSFFFTNITPSLTHMTHRKPYFNLTFSHKEISVK